MPGFGDSTDLTLVPMTGRPPDQVGYVVHDLEEAAHRLGHMLGISRWVGWRYADGYLPHRRFRGAEADYESIGVVAEYGPSLEIIAPLSGDSVFTEFLEARGPGLHHVGYFVPSLDDERDRLAAHGWQEIQYGGGHGMDGDGQIAFYESINGAGSYLEVIEPPKRRYPNHFEILLDPGAR